MTITEILFGCQHERRCWPRRDRQGEYQRCLDCGRRLEYSFASLGEINSKPAQIFMENEFVGSVTEIR